MSEDISHLKKPPIFRVLIIDDQVCSGRETISAKAFQEGIATYIKHLVINKTERRIRNVDICFAGTPEEGVNRWKNEIFDLTLVDSDLKSSASTPKDKTEIQNFLDIIPSLKGAYIFRLLWDLMNDEKDDNPYQAYRDGCRVVFWTGLRTINDDGRQDKLTKILAPCFKSSHWFIPKRKDDNECQWANVLDNNSSVTTLENCIQESLENYDKEISWRSLLARYITLYRVKSPSDFQRITNFSEWVKQGYLYVGNGSVFFSDSRPDGKAQYVELSPRLRFGNPSFKTLIEGDVQCLSCDDRIPWDKTWLFPPKSLATTHPSTLVAAATPLTGCSAVGRNRAIDLMVDKVAALLNGPFDQVVLKTVYLDFLDQWKNLHWPVLQVQSHHRTRCLRSVAHPRTLWNAGTTASESFNPEMMHDFLWEFAQKHKEECTRTIVSLGSKFPQHDLTEKPYRQPDKVFSSCETEFKNDLTEIWYKLFGTLFQEEGNENSLGADVYPMVEINVRHYLRECIAFHLGGDEYLSPAVDKENITRADVKLNFTGSYESLDSEFKAWLEIIDSVAGKYRKKVLLKLPFRSDILHFVQMIREHVDVRKRGDLPCLISGITLINAYKSSVVSSGRVGKYSPAWYGRLDEWDNDFKKEKYQVSGEMLKVSRYQLLNHVFELVSDVNLQVHLSGGIMDAEDIKLCHDYKASVQIGTWALMDLNLSRQVWSSCTCGASAKMCKVNETDVGETKTKPQSEQFKPRIAFLLHELCNGCGKCSRTYYCDTFLDRRGYNLPPVMDLRNCTGCGLCAQICPNGAIQLFAAPEHVVILIAEENQLREWHRRLNACEIPHLPYSVDDIRTGNKPSGNQEQSSVFPTWKDVVEKEGDGAAFLGKCMVIYVDSDGKIFGRDSDGVEKVLEWVNACELRDESNKDWLAGVRAEVNKRLRCLRRNR